MKTISFEEERKAAFAKLAEFKARANTPAEKAAYEERLKNLRDYCNTIETAVQEARAEAAYNLKKEVVANMHNMGVSVSVISHCVDMTEEEVQNIIQSLS